MIVDLIGDEAANGGGPSVGEVPLWIAEYALISVLLMGLLSLGLGILVGFLHRTYANTRVPFYAPVLVGLGAVGLWINSASVLIMTIQSITDEAADPLVLANAEANLMTALVAGVAAYGGGRVGDRVAPNIRALTGARQVETEVSKLVRTVGRVITVEIPKTIHPIDGYDPVTEETRTQLAGREFVFPRGLTVEELRERIVDRLREDYGVGYVDIEIDQDGEITYLALGRRVAGIGPTLPPRRVAIALTAHPPPKASPGDIVQVWELPPEAGEANDAAEEPFPPALTANPDRWYRPDSEEYAFAVRLPEGGRRYRRTAAEAAALLTGVYGASAEPEPPVPPAATRVAQAELRATTGDIATVVIDVNRLEFIDQSKTYRLVTLPATKRPEQEFASLLRTANDSMETVTVAKGSPLVGVPVGALRPDIVAIKPRNGAVETLPSTTRPADVGDRLYAIGRPEQLRKLGDAAGA